MFLFKQKTAYDMRISYWSSDVCSSDLGEAPAVVTQKSRTGQAVRLSRQGSGGRVPPLASESEPDPRRIAGEARRCEGDVVLVTQVPAPPFAGQVDPFDETGDARNELPARARRSEEHTSELQSLMRNPYAVLCLKKKNTTTRVHYMHRK